MQQDMTYKILIVDIVTYLQSSQGEYTQLLRSDKARNTKCSILKGNPNAQTTSTLIYPLIPYKINTCLFPISEL